MKGILLKQNKTKICLLFGIILLLATCASLAMVTTTAKAESNGKLIFNLINSGTEYDVCIDDKSQTRVVIPSTYKDKPVTKISNNGFASCQNLEVVIIPNSINTIGNNAFLNCRNLKTVKMPNVKNIGTNAFGLCSKILQFAIRDSVETIGATAFRGFTSASTIYVEPSSMKSTWNANCFASCNATILYETYTPADLELEPMTRDNVEGWRVGYKDINNPLAEVVISSENTPDGKPILEIDQYAFTGSKLDKVIIKDSIYPINIKSGAFNSSYINEIDLGSNVTFYDDLSGDTMLDSISGKNISDSVFASSIAVEISTQYNHSIITRDMFNGAENLRSLKLNGEINTLPDGIQYINEDAFKMDFSIRTLFIPSTIEIIGQNAFAEWGTRGEQELVIDKFNISDEERQQCGDAIITVNSIEINYVTNSSESLETTRVSRFGNEQKFSIPKRKGYEFKGWYDQQGYDSYNDECGIGNLIAKADGTLSLESIENYRDTTLYAKWNIINYNITWEMNGASGTGNFIDTYNVKTNYNIPDVSLSGYTFSGWSQHAIGNNRFTSITENSMTGDITLYAIFFANISIVGDGGYTGWLNGETLIPFENHTVREAIGSTIKTDDIFKEGYKTSWTDGNKKVGVQENYKVTGNATLRADFEEKTIDECYDVYAYKIFTPNQLNAIRTKTNQNTAISVIIGDNITVENWEPIPEFNGSMSTDSGKRVIIKSFQTRTNTGFIGTNYGHLQIEVEANARITGGEYAGIIAGENKGYLQQCSTYGSISSKAKYTGGVVGINNATVMNSTNYAAITTEIHAGGVIGYQAGTGFNQNSKNYGRIIFSCTSVLYSYHNIIGGIVGHDNGESLQGYNYAFIEFSGSANMVSYHPNVGGAIGYAESGKHREMYYKKNGFIRGNLSDKQMVNVQNFADGTL